MTKAMRTVSFKLPEELDRALDELARRRNMSRSGLVREALEILTAGERPSVTTLTDRIIGTVAGPVYLSTDPKHLASYGK